MKYSTSTLLRTVTRRYRQTGEAVSLSGVSDRFMNFSISHKRKREWVRFTWEEIRRNKIVPENNKRLKDAARTLLTKASVKADGSELARACAELHELGLCEWRPAEEKPIKFDARYKATVRTQEAL